MFHPIDISSTSNAHMASLYFLCPIGIWFVALTSFLLGTVKVTTGSDS